MLLQLFQFALKFYLSSTGIVDGEIINKYDIFIEIFEKEIRVLIKRSVSRKKTILKRDKIVLSPAGED